MTARVNTFTSLLIVALVFVGNLSAAPEPQETLAKLSQGKRVKVVLKNGEQLVGRLGPLQADSFRLDPDNKTGTGRILQFPEVRSVSTKMTKAQNCGLAAAIYGGLCIIGAVVLGK